jgi:acetylornithine deacetylase/succinyl-diaminopimelate desuccinylase-like protein
VCDACAHARRCKIQTKIKNKNNNSKKVLEYSELDPAEAAAVDPATGQLLYNWANICMHYFDAAWLAAEGGIPSVAAGPGSIAQAHTADEWIDLDQVDKAADILCGMVW